MQLPDEKSKSYTERLLDDYEAAGGWINRKVFGLSSFPAMGYGAIAKSDIPSDTPLFHVPLGMILSAHSSDLGTKLSAEEWESLGTGWSTLILTMMWESSKGPASAWNYYLESMPTEFDTPMLWEPEHLAELAGTDVAKRIGREEAESEYSSSIQPILKAHPDLFPANSPHFDLTAFHLHGSRILSRSFMVPASIFNVKLQPDDDDADSDDEADDLMTVMIPMADMLNAAYHSDNARLFDDDDDASQLRPGHLGPGFTMVSTKEVKQDEQIFNTYSSPPNSELLRKYGHVDVLPLDNDILSCLDDEWIGGWPYGNPGDEVELDGNLVVEAFQNLGGASTVVEERVNYWLDDGQEDAFYLTLTDSIDRGLIAFARILLYDNEWLRFKDKGKLPAAVVDKTVHAILKGAIEKRLSFYKTDLQSDLELLKKQEPMSVRARAAAIVRVGEKRILMGAMRALLAGATETAEAPSKRRDPDGQKDPAQKRRKS